jgi:hypothetical protein
VSGYRGHPPDPLSRPHCIGTRAILAQLLAPRSVTRRQPVLTRSVTPQKSDAVMKTNLNRVFWVILSAR